MLRDVRNGNPWSRDCVPRPGYGRFVFRSPDEAQLRRLRECDVTFATTVPGVGTSSLVQATAVSSFVARTRRNRADSGNATRCPQRQSLDWNRDCVPRPGYDSFVLRSPDEARPRRLRECDAISATEIPGVGTASLVQATTVSSFVARTRRDRADSGDATGSARDRPHPRTKCRNTSGYRDSSSLSCQRLPLVLRALPAGRTRSSPVAAR